MWKEEFLQDILTILKFNNRKSKFSEGGRLDEELNFLNHIQSRSYDESGMQSGPVRESGLGGGYQVIIQVSFNFWKTENII